MPDPTVTIPTLPRRAPADLGVSSAGIAAFLDAIEASPDIELHSLMVLRHGQVLGEGWWAPYRPDGVHLLYSLSKSFTSTACGFAAAEGLLSLDDTVVSHFPELAELADHAWTRAITIGNLAAMATGHQLDTLDRAFRLSPRDLVRGFLMIPPDVEPGSVFAYNNGATYVLGAVVQRVSGQTLTEYLRPRLLDPLGIVDTFWDRHGSEREIGFSGLHLSTESIATFGQLYLDDGRWQGRQVLPEGWVAQASRLHTPNPAEPNPDWQQGYGYQFWRSRHGYRGDGAYGQFCLVLPEQDSVVVTTAQTENMQGILDAVWAHLLPAFDGAVSAEADVTLGQRLSGLALPVTPALLLPSDPSYAADGWVTAVGLAEHDQGGWTLTLLDHGQHFEVRCGDGEFLPTAVDAGPGRWLPVEGSGRWLDADTFVASLIVLQTPHRLEIRLQPQTCISTAVWHTVPLRTSSLLGLATEVPPAAR